MKLWDTLCWAVITLGLVLACTKPKPEPPAPPHEFTEASEDALAAAPERTDRPLEGFAKELLPEVFLFDLNSSVLQHPDQVAVLARSLKQSGAAVRLEGHACQLGETAYNAALGYHRAMAVRAYLVAYGVPGGKIEVVSYGEKRPLAHIPDELWRNRRVEVKVQ